MTGWKEFEISHSSSNDNFFKRSKIQDITIFIFYKYNCIGALKLAYFLLGKILSDTISTQNLMLLHAVYEQWRNVKDLSAQVKSLNYRMCLFYSPQLKRFSSSPLWLCTFGFHFFLLKYQFLDKIKSKFCPLPSKRELAWIKRPVARRRTRYY